MAALGQNLFVGWLRSLIERLERPYRRAPQPHHSTRWAEADATEVTEPDLRNQLSPDGWVARWQPTTYARRRDCMWVRRQGGELLVFPGAQDRPRIGTGPYFRLSDNIVYRASGHPDGPSSLPWMVIRNARVYPGEGYPGGPSDGARYRVEDQMTPRTEGVTIRPVGDRDYRRGPSL